MDRYAGGDALPAALELAAQAGAPANDVAFYLPIPTLMQASRRATSISSKACVIESERRLSAPCSMPDSISIFLMMTCFDRSARLRMAPWYWARTDIAQLCSRMWNASRSTPTECWLGSCTRGGILIASRRQPAMAPGFAVTETEDAEIHRISQDLFSYSSKTSRFIEDEKTHLAAVLRTILSPDVVLAPEVPEIGFVHRKTGDAEIYFLANSSSARQITRASFRVAGLEAEWWNPMSGQITPASTSPDREGRTSVALELEPYEGRFLVFSKRTARDPFGVKASEPASLDMSAGWRVTFGSVGISKTMEHLSSWIDDEAIKYFSGVAVYEKTVSVPESMLKPGMTQRLDFGEGKPLAETSSGSNGMQARFEGPVREAAVVYVNEQRAGSVWCPPYAVEVTGFLKQGDNAIRILVANTAVNHMAGRSLPDYRLLNQRYGKRFDPQDMDKIQPIPSGLLLGRFSLDCRAALIESKGGGTEYAGEHALCRMVFAPAGRLRRCAADRCRFQENP